MAKKINKTHILTRGLALLAAVLLICGIGMPTAHAAESNRVDHVDIGVSLTADIKIDGVLYEHQTYTLEKSDLTPENFSITSTANNFTYNLDRITTSTGSSGVRQFRISGSFPVGTKDNPIRYTLTLNKVVAVNTAAGPVHIPVTFTANIGYWDHGNDCPGLGRSWNSGGFSRSAGLDFVLGNAHGDVHTTGTISIQKILTGLELPTGETKTFTFDIYTADGDLYTTLNATVGASSPYATTSISDVPYGTYYVVERDAQVEGYTLDVEYHVDNGEITGSRTENFVLSEGNANVTAYVENIYSAIPAPLEGDGPAIPDTTEPETTEPETTEPETTEPETTEPETTEPETTEPETTEPETTEPETTEPETTEPVMSDVPRTGSAMGLWTLLSILSGFGMICAIIPGRKKKD